MLEGVGRGSGTDRGNPLFCIASGGAKGGGLKATWVLLMRRTGLGSCGETDEGLAVPLFHSSSSRISVRIAATDCS